MLAERMHRADLLQTLESVVPGLSRRESVEQSGSFVFRRGRVLTFNEEVSCRTRSGLPKEFTGAVRHKAFLELLRKMKDEEIGLDVTKDGFLLILGRNRKAKLRMDAEITIPLDGLEMPSNESWTQLDERFGEAINIVKGCAGSDTSQFVGVCIHIHPKWVEATDGYQMARFALPTGVSESILVKKDSIKDVSSLDMTEVNTTSRWLHFRNPAGLIYSCLRYTEDYPDLKQHLSVKGEQISLPKGLASAIEAASIFSKENADSNLVVVEIVPGKLTLTGVGTSGEYTEYKKVVYSGQPLRFTIPPEILNEVSQKHNNVVLNSERLRVGGEHWRYCTTLGSPDALKSPDPKKKESSHDGEGDDPSDE